MFEESFLLVPLVATQGMIQRVALQLRCHLDSLVVGDREVVLRGWVLEHALEQRGVGGLESFAHGQFCEDDVYVADFEAVAPGEVRAAVKLAVLALH